MPDTIKLAEKGVLLAKIEAEYGTDPTPTGAANAIRAEDIKLEVVTKKIDRNYMQPYMGARAPLVVTQSYKITFKTEIKGSGSAGTAPEIDPLFRACNLDVTTVPATSVTYAPNSDLDSAESTTIYFYIDGIEHQLQGCRGTFNLEAKAGEYGYINWEFTGIYEAPSDVANPTPTWNATLPPRFVSAAFALHSYSAVIENLKIDLGNTLYPRPSANAATGIVQYMISGRKVTGSVDPELVTLATKNWFTIFAAGTQSTFTGKFGATAGNILTITGSKIMLDDVKYGERGGIATNELPLVFVPTTAGNDEIAFAFT